MLMGIGMVVAMLMGMGMAVGMAIVVMLVGMGMAVLVVMSAAKMIMMDVHSSGSFAFFLTL